MYLDWDPSSYPLLQKIQQSVDKYTRLWHTALDFHERYERWYYGPLKVSQIFQLSVFSIFLSKYLNVTNWIVFLFSIHV